MPVLRRPAVLLALLTLLLAILAMLRPIDHDESQYVAATVLSAHGWLPYRDYAYLQTPLQPLLFAPIVWIADEWSWPALRLANALCGVIAVAAVWRAAHAGGAVPWAASIAAGLFAGCDALLFSAGTARNDALPAALLAAALVPIVRASRGQGTRDGALLAGLLLAAAAAAKASYGVPALAFGAFALWDRRQRPGWVALGAAPMVALVAALYASAPGAFVFDVVTFAARAPAEYYTMAGKAWKLGIGAKLIDTVKFLALGAGLLALITAPRTRWRGGQGRAVDMLMVAGIAAALLPSPTWRQYLLPILPPLFVRTAIAWSIAPPRARLVSAMAPFAIAGMVPSALAIAHAAPPPLFQALADGAAARRALDAAGVTGPVATLSPQLLPATGRLPDRRFATGPFYFRSRALLPARRESELYLVSGARLDALGADPPDAILAGGETPQSAGDPRLDARLERYAIEHRWRFVPVSGGRLRLYVRPRVGAR